MALGTVKAPSQAQLAALAQELGFHMSDAELADYHEALMPSIGAYNAIDRMAQELPPVKYPRTPGSRPSAAEDPHGARRRASSRARRSRSRTTSASPACR